MIWTYLVADLKTCLERNKERSKELEDKVIHILWREFEDLDADLVIDIDDRGVKDAVQAIIRFLSKIEDGEKND